MSNITSLIPAVYTPFHPDGRLNLAMIEKQVASLVKHQIEGAFVCGTTGESLSLTTEERQAIAQRWVEVSPKDFKVIVHTGHNSLDAAVALTKHANKIGAWGTAAMPPNFFRPTNQTDLLVICQKLASAAPEMPFYYYHIPPMTGVHLPMLDFLKAAKKSIPNLGGIKYSDGNLLDMGLCVVEANGKYDILFGKDEIFMAAMSLGAKGGVGSTYNYMAPIYHKLIQHFQNNNLKAALEVQKKIMKTVHILEAYGGGVIFGKAVMKMIGIDCGPVRLPLKDLDAMQLKEVERKLADVGFDRFSM